MEASPVVSAGGDFSTEPQSDIEFRLEFDIEEDIEAELEEFVGLARLGLFEKAREYFEQTLQDHLSLFPVFAEYAEFLVATEEHLELRDLVSDGQWDGFSPDEIWLVTLLAALASSELENDNSQAVQAAHKWHDTQASTQTWEPDEVKLQCLEIYMLIVTDYRTFHDLDESSPYSNLPGRIYSGDRWSGFDKLVFALLDDGKMWEALGLAKRLFRIHDLEDEHGAYLFSEISRRLDTPAIDTCEDGRESRLIATLHVSNLLFELKLAYAVSKSTTATWNELMALKNRSLASLRLLFPEFPFNNSRPTKEYVGNSVRLFEVMAYTFKQSFKRLHYTIGMTTGWTAQTSPIYRHDQRSQQPYAGKPNIGIPGSSAVPDPVAGPRVDDVFDNYSQRHTYQTEIQKLREKLVSEASQNIQDTRYHPKEGEVLIGMARLDQNLALLQQWLSLVQDLNEGIRSGKRFTDFPSPFHDKRYRERELNILGNCQEGFISSVESLFRSARTYSPLHQKRFAQENALDLALLEMDWRKLMPRYARIERYLQSLSSGMMAYSESPSQPSVLDLSNAAGLRLDEGSSGF